MTMAGRRRLRAFIAVPLAEVVSVIRFSLVCWLACLTANPLLAQDITSRAPDHRFIARQPPLSPSEQQGRFHAPEGFRVELVAAEPEIGKHPMAFKIFPGTAMALVDKQSVVVEWRDPIFRNPTRTKITEW